MIKALEILNRQLPHTVTHGRDKSVGKVEGWEAGPADTHLGVSVDQAYQAISRLCTEPRTYSSLVSTSSLTHFFPFHLFRWFGAGSKQAKNSGFPLLTGVLTNASAVLPVFRKWETPTQRKYSAKRGAKNNATKFPPEATSLCEGSVYTAGVWVPG